jgi:photosystem II stability/assembly factor-like uncharacterized protein
MLRLPLVILVALGTAHGFSVHAQSTHGPSVHARAAQDSVSDSSLFGDLRWRNIGPNRGGRSIAVTGSASRPFEYYFGAAGGGLWKTRDDGTTWAPVTDGQIRSSSVGAVAVAESDPDVVYIGMGETELRGNIMQGDGVYRSADAGQSWSPVGLTTTQAISRIRIDPADANRVYVAALGHPYAPNEDRGVFRSINGGAAGPESCSATTGRAPLTSSSTLTTLVRCTPRCGRSTVGRGCCGVVGRVRDSSSRSTVVTAGRN